MVLRGPARICAASMDGCEPRRDDLGTTSAAAASDPLRADVGWNMEVVEVDVDVGERNTGEEGTRVGRRIGRWEKLLLCLFAE
jgi:hypothetical protein